MFLFENVLQKCSFTSRQDSKITVNQAHDTLAIIETAQLSDTKYIFRLLSKYLVSIKQHFLQNMDKSSKNVRSHHRHILKKLAIQYESDHFRVKVCYFINMADTLHPVEKW